ncbi:carboxylesterase family protein [Hymenobacter persicinus]|uniref:Carboxylic ester hydrolase n=1 Tax=Hymenobacter persicinus TaxID=2025506 RepID=A0A4Q5LFK9_9BACT|nr:carboxylesterase family protein [Hymenobacter persicinus]RYU81615.1 carboxylesterase/lipase family protein [Hymenobacter persicinus]
MSAASAPQFHAPAGTIIGWTDGPVVRATGIRYARAARFQPPVAEPAAVEPILATAAAPACPQVADPRLAVAFGDFYADATFDEDCLRLSVTRPADFRPGETLPVLVWVHGGSYVTGAGDVPLYDPAALVQEQRVVFVAVTYRLGLLGFLGGPGGSPPNLGLLDLREALRWVQRNSAAFGGNPALVTLLGHSSGADAIAHLMVAEGTAGLFRRVILHSAPLGLAPNRGAMTQAMRAAVGDVEPAADVAQVLAREESVNQAVRRFGLKSGMPFGTQYGAYPLPAEADVEQAWRAVAPAVDVLVGATAEETRFFAFIDPRLAWIERVPVVGGLLTRALVRITSNRIYLKPARTFARRQSEAGGRAYRFEVLFSPAGPALGAAHTVDLPLLLGTRAGWAATALLGASSWERVDAAGRQVRQLWTDFARTGVLPAAVDIPGVLRLRQEPAA